MKKIFLILFILIGYLGYSQVLEPKTAVLNGLIINGKPTAAIQALTVAPNGYQQYSIDTETIWLKTESGWVNTGASSGADWDTNLINIPNDIADGDDDTQLTPTQVVAAVDSEYPDLDTDDRDDIVRGNNVITQDFTLGNSDGAGIAINVSNGGTTNISGGLFPSDRTELVVGANSIQAIGYSNSDINTLGDRAVITKSYGDANYLGTGTDDQTLAEVLVQGNIMTTNILLDANVSRSIGNITNGLASIYNRSYIFSPVTSDITYTSNLGQTFYRSDLGRISYWNGTETKRLATTDEINDQTAFEVATNTTNFDGQLSSSEDTVQKALDALDDLDATNIPYSYNAINTSVGAQLDALRTGGITANQAQSIANTGLKFFRTVTDGESTALGHVRIVTDASADYGKAVINKHTLATEITVTLDSDVPDGGVISYYNQNADGVINFLPDTGFTINGFSDRKAVNDTTAFSGFIRDGTNFISLGGNELVALLPSNLYTNLDVVNPENETNANTGWTDFGVASTLSIETSNVQNGSFAYRLTNNAPGVNLAVHYYEITVEDGATYDFSFWGYEPTTSKVEISLTEYGGSTIFNGVSAKDVWEEKTGSFTVTGSTTVRINMRVNTEAGEFGLFDNFTITKQ